MVNGEGSPRVSSSAMKGLPSPRRLDGARLNCSSWSTGTVLGVTSCAIASTTPRKSARMISSARRNASLSGERGRCKAAQS
jgi:hypothetical protein